MTVRIVAPHFVAGVVIERNEVVRAASILKYMVGWNFGRVASYVISKGWAFG